MMDFDTTKIETKLLSSLIFNHNLIEKLIPFLRPEMFCVELNRASYKIISEMSMDGKSVTIENVVLSLMESGQKVEPDYFMEVSELGELEAATVIADSWKKRTAITEMRELAQHMKNGYQPGSILKTATRLMDLDITEEEIIPTKTLIEMALAEGDARGGPKWNSFVDEKYGGIQLGKLIVLAAASKAGKTRFAVSTFHSLIMQEQKADYISLEMYPTFVMKLLFAKQARINDWFIFKNDVPHNLYEQFSLAIGELGQREQNYRIVNHLYDREKLFSYLRVYSRTVKYFFIDFLTCIPNPTRDDNKFYGEICAGLARICKEKNVTIFLVAQMRKDADTADTPTVDMIEGTGKIKQFADMLIVMSNLSKIKKEGTELGTRLRFSVTDRLSRHYESIDILSDLGQLKFDQPSGDPL